MVRVAEVSQALSSLLREANEIAYPMQPEQPLFPGHTRPPESSNSERYIFSSKQNR